MALREMGPPQNRYSGKVIGQYAGGGLRLLSTRHPPGVTVPWHEHDHSYLTLVTRGWYREETRGRGSEMATGTALLHPAGERHQDRFGPVVTELVNLEVSTATLARLGVVAATFDCRLELDRRSARRLHALVAVELSRADDLTPLALEAALLEVAEGASSVNGPMARAPRWLRALDRLLVQRFAEPWSLPALAEEVGVHPQHVNRAFRRYRGVTIGARLRELRLEHAAALLASRLPLAEVALRAGFYDQSHMTRCFARRYGMPPGAYRSAVARPPQSARDRSRRGGARG